MEVFKTRWLWLTSSLRIAFVIWFGVFILNAVMKWAPVELAVGLLVLGGFPLGFLYCIKLSHVPRHDPSNLTVGLLSGESAERMGRVEGA